MSIDLIYQDDDLIVVNKPSGLLCVPGLSSPDNLQDRCIAEFPNAKTVHRLDMATSGLVIFALNYEAQKQLSIRFQNREIRKQYHAEIDGLLAHSCGEIHSPLICDWDRRPRQKIDWLTGKASSTFFKRIKLFSTSTLVSLSPLTGRTHQLRMHMLQIGHPILGDSLYNAKVSEDFSPHLKLHASWLKFPHPTEDRFVECNTPAAFDR
jgi:tRNA pseudouridine32 synthase/23S rRNA pseudouridine746 synthase